MERYKGNMKLWYNKPAARWEEALPIGNGRFGAMIYGNALNENIQMNEDTFWSGSPRNTTNPHAPNYIKKVRELVHQGEYAEAEKIVKECMQGPEVESYQPLGNIYLDFRNKSEVTGYKRELDLDTAIMKVEYEQEGVKYKREYFTSAPDQVMVISISSNEPGKLNFSLSLSSPHPNRLGKCKDKDLFMYGFGPARVFGHVVKCKEHVIYDKDENGRGMKFEAAVKILECNGKCEHREGLIEISEADKVILLVSAATSFNGYDKDPGLEGKNPSRINDDYLKQASAYSYEQLKKNHIDDYRNLYGRMDIYLGENNLSSLPTDERIEAVQKGNDDPQLLALFFQYARYLLISSSRPGTQAANLQGIWNDKVRPPWACCWTININIQMNYWIAESCNLSECHEPVFDLLEGMRDTGSTTAKVNYKCRGWLANHNVDLWRTTTPVGGEPRWAFWPLGGAWMSQHLWEHYLYTGDIEFLKNKAYPILKEAAIFLLDWMYENEEGYLVTCPSTSPENVFISPKNEISSISEASTMDISIARDLFTSCIEASIILGTDEDFRAELETALKKLPPFKIGKYGQLQEWHNDFEEAEPGHRHFSHLYGLHPGSQILLRKNPELIEACRKSIERRIAHGGAHNEWSCAWLICFYARMEDSTNCYLHLCDLIKKWSLPNLFGKHPQLQIDSNFGGAAGMAEMLMQSHAGEINLLPALPEQWKDGYIKGLKARGGFEIDLEWKNGKLYRSKVVSKLGGICRIRYKDKLKLNNNIKVTYLEDNVFEFMTTKGMEYELSLD